MKIHSIRKATKEELDRYKQFTKHYELEGCWVINDDHFVVKHSDSDMLHVYTNGEYLGWADWNGEVGNAIKRWELTSNLSPDTKQSFDDLIDTIL
jgi:hypothetical protein